jgi:hypothetical protein
MRASNKLFTHLCCNSGNPQLSNRQHGVPGSSLTGHPLQPGHLRSRFFHHLRLLEKAIISQQRQFDLLLAAMLEKILDQVMDIIDNMPEVFVFSCHTLKTLLLETHFLSDHEKLDVLYKSKPLVG